MSRDSVLTALAFHRFSKADRSSSENSDAFDANDFDTGAGRGHPAKRLPPEQLLKIDDVPVLPVLTPAVNVY